LSRGWGNFQHGEKPKYLNQKKQKKKKNRGGVRGGGGGGGVLGGGGGGWGGGGGGVGSERWIRAGLSLLVRE